MSVYLETNLWNVLCDHPVDADTLVGSLVPAPDGHQFLLHLGQLPEGSVSHALVPIFLVFVR
jgi:hypothetical protein